MRRRRACLRGFGPGSVKVSGLGGWVGLLVVVAVLGGFSAFEPPVDLVGVRVSPFAHPDSKPGSSTIGIGSGDAGATAPTTILASVGMNGDCAGMGAVTTRQGLLGARHETGA